MQEEVRDEASLGFSEEIPGTDAYPPESAIAKQGFFQNRYYILAILSLIYACNVMDRSVITLLIEPIKAEFQLSDSQLGLLTGLAFSAFFVIAAIPLGVAADRTNRRNLIGACLVVWSVMTALCGAARNFPQLLLARVGVGIGEAGATPGSMSMIADLFPARERATATAIFYLAVPLGTMLAFVGGGWLAHIYGWRGVFFAAAIPGLVLALVHFLTVREPKRISANEQADTAEKLPVFQTLRFILSQRALLHIMAGMTLTSFAISGVGAFKTAFFMRVYDVSLTEIAPIMGGILSVFMLVGILVGGIVSDRMARLDERWRCWVVAICVALYAPFNILMALSPNLTLSLIFSAGSALVMSAWTGPSFALTYGLVAPRMRATTVAVIMVCTNLIGYGLGPMFVGLLSDAFEASFGREALRYALVAVACVVLWGGLHYVLCSFRLKQGMARAAAL